MNNQKAEGRKRKAQPDRLRILKQLAISLPIPAWEYVLEALAVKAAMDSVGDRLDLRAINTGALIRLAIQKNGE
jgi:hypothetical protein